MEWSAACGEQILATASQELTSSHAWHKMSADMPTVPTFCVDNAAGLAHIVGMSSRHAVNTRQSAATSRMKGLRSSGIQGFFRAAQLEAAGLTRDQLPALLRAGLIERVARGLYRIAEAEPTENYSLAMACARVPNSIVCLLSALRVHGIGTQVPAAVWLAIGHKARTPRLRELRHIGELGDRQLLAREQRHQPHPRGVGEQAQQLGGGAEVGHGIRLSA